MARCGICDRRGCTGHSMSRPRKPSEATEYAKIEAEMRRRGYRVNQPTRTKALEENVKGIVRWLRK